MSVVLRPVQPGDLDAHFEQQRDPASVAMAGVPARDRPAFEAHWREILADPSITVRTIEVDGEVAGHVTTFVIGRRRVGYWLDRRFWGRGIATRALAAFLEELPERPLHATASRTNAASIRVLERNGFVADPDDDEPEVAAFVLR